MESAKACAKAERPDPAAPSNSICPGIVSPLALPNVLEIKMSRCLIGSWPSNSPRFKKLLLEFSFILKHLLPCHYVIGGSCELGQELSCAWWWAAEAGCGWCQLSHRTGADAWGGWRIWLWEKYDCPAAASFD